MSGVVSEAGNADDMYLNWAVDAMNSLRSESREVAGAVEKAVDDGTLDGRTMRRVQTLIDRLQNMICWKIRLYVELLWPWLLMHLRIQL